MQLAEASNWTIPPWRWQDVPDFWVEKLNLYWAARAKVEPILEAKRRRRAEQQAG